MYLNPSTYRITGYVPGEYEYSAILSSVACTPNKFKVCIHSNNVHELKTSNQPTTDKKVMCSTNNIVQTATALTNRAQKTVTLRQENLHHVVDNPGIYPKKTTSMQINTYLGQLGLALQNL
jgi:hypothetical protein